ncbi:AAA family ATPase [Candidatus Parcubacteria bacterium]|nr:AAA family ATPase [Candidatus Parcubacteria bacterium]
MKIIGLSGTNGSGKDTVAEFLKDEHGFYIASATDMLEAELKKLDRPTDRTHKRELGNQWRRDQGLGVIVQRAVEEAKKAGFDKVVVGSLRNSGEADLVHALGGKVIWVDADPLVRYQRVISGKRGRIEDSKSYEEFLSDEEAEMNEQGDAATLSMAEVKAKSDIFIENNYEDIAKLKTELKKALAIVK